MNRLVLLTIGMSLAVSAARADWIVRERPANDFPADIVEETRAPAPEATSIPGQTTPAGRLPDGLLVDGPGDDIKAAWYAGPTLRYRHGILGDSIEAEALVVELDNGRRLVLVLPQNEVFEDRYPRLVDLDGDGTTEIITLRASSRGGGSVTVYGVVGGGIVERGTTGFIGTANRWLNVAGIAPYLGGSDKQIAYVETPHIGGTLYLYRFTSEGLALAGSLFGFSNHVIGSIEMRLSATADITGDGVPDLAVPSANRRALRLITFGPSGPREIAAVSVPGRIDKAIAAEGSGRDLRFIVGLSDGSVHEIRRP